MMRFETRPALITIPILMGHLFTADQYSPELSLPRAFPVKHRDWQGPGKLRWLGTSVGLEPQMRAAGTGRRMYKKNMGH